MKKKILMGIIVIVVVIACGVGYYFYFHRGSSVGIDDNIQNESQKEGSGSIELDSSRTLVVYFSETGNTQRLAKLISDEVGGDFRRIETVKPYPTGDELFDVIFVGYPIWWYTLPMPLYSFFDQYDLSGKIIVPFNTHEGSGDGGTYTTIQELEPNATILDGLAIRGGDMESNQTDTVRSWLNELEFDKK